MRRGASAGTRSSWTWPMSSRRNPIPYQRRGYPAPVEQILQVQFEGGRAVDDGQPMSACPYVGDVSDKGIFLAKMWFRGYRARQDEIRSATSDNEQQQKG